MRKLIIIFIILINALGTSQARTGEGELGRRYLKLGNTYREAGNTELSEKYLLKGYSIVKKYSDFYWIAVAEEYLGYYYIDSKEYSKAMKFFKSAKSIYDVYGRLRNGEGSNKAITGIIESIKSKITEGKDISFSENDVITDKDKKQTGKKVIPGKLNPQKSKQKTILSKDKEIITGGGDSNEEPIADNQKKVKSILEIEKETFEKINQFRRDKGLKALIWDENIASECRQHSADMLNGSVPFGHEGFDMRTDRINRELSTSYTGENVVYTYEQLGPVESAFQAWINSPGHYKNIVDPEYTMSAMGAVRSPEGKYYMTQIFSGK